MLIACKICKVEHDSRDINSKGICVWCEQQEDRESIFLQQEQFYFQNFTTSEHISRKFILKKSR